VDVPTIPENNPTQNISKRVLEAYLGKVVDSKCGQIFSVGVSAITKTESIGAITNTAIKTELMDQTSKSRKIEILFSCIFSSIKTHLIEPNLHQTNIADDRIITIT